MWSHWMGGSVKLGQRTRKLEIQSTRAEHTGLNSKLSLWVNFSEFPDGHSNEHKTENILIAVRRQGHLRR